MIKTTDDLAEYRWMMRAYSEACMYPDKNRNKACGAVVVQAGAVVGIGHRQTVPTSKGEKVWHAEEMAIKMAGDYCAGASIYATLEPCTVRYKGAGVIDSRPCVDLIAEAGIVRVVFGVPDSDFGAGGARQLAERGIEVAVHVGIDVDAFRSLTNDPVLPEKYHEEYAKFLESLK